MSQSSFPKFDTSTNTILGGKIHLTQPVEGYRASIDPLFLAASVQAQENDTVLELGTGAGTALLALAHRIPKLKITALEFQRDMVRLANHNIKANGFQDRLEVLHGDLLTPPPRLAASSFSHVMANPPYFESKASVESANETKSLSNHDGGVPLTKWIDFAYRMVKPKGYVSFVFTTDRLDDLLAAMYGKFGEVTLFPLWPKTGQKAKRLIVQGRKNVKSPARMLSGLTLHQDNGTYTPEAEAILRQGKGLKIS